jgi:hypothetical protein
MICHSYLRKGLSLRPTPTDWSRLDGRVEQGEITIGLFLLDEIQVSVDSAPAFPASPQTLRLA